VTILHPWESGIDLSPAYDPALGVPENARARPSWKQAYSPLIKLVLQYNFIHGWDQKGILERERAPKLSPFKSWFRVQDIAVNSVYASGWGVLGDLASTYDTELAQKCYKNQGIAEAAILKYMYNPETRQFHHLWISKDGIQHKYPVKTIQTLFPILLSSLPQEALHQILHLIRDPDEFGTKYMIPTVSKSEPEYNPIANTLLLWRGPIWGFTNWFIMEGLEKHHQRYSNFELD
jgi:Glycosyl hydrolase family 63 C-terminal domain